MKAAQATDSDRGRRGVLAAGAALTGLSFLELSTRAATGGVSEQAGPPAEDARRARGLAAIEQLTGATSAAVIDSLQDIAPDLGDWIIDFAYGDVFSRPDLDLRSRQFATIAALTAMGTAVPQPKVHIHGGLNVGCAPREIVEVMLQMALYADFPSSINALNAAREVFEERGVSAVAPAGTGAGGSDG